jgi:hypothetical protein
LLCNDCNWEFIGYAVPGILSRYSRRRRSKGSAGSSERKNSFTSAPFADSNDLSETMGLQSNELESANAHSETTSKNQGAFDTDKKEETIITSQPVKLKKRVRVKLK